MQLLSLPNFESYGGGPISNSGSLALESLVSDTTNWSALQDSALPIVLIRPTK